MSEPARVLCIIKALREVLSKRAYATTDQMFCKYIPLCVFSDINLTFTLDGYYAYTWNVDFFTVIV